MASTALTVLAGCGAEPEGEPGTEPVASFSEPIQGGYLDETDKAVVGIVILASGGVAGCTGSLIAPNLVLTAHHCVAPSSGGGGVICGQTVFYAPFQASDILVHTDTYTPMLPTMYTAAAEIVLPSADDGFCGNDQALLVLSEPIDGAVTAPLVPRVDVPLEAGEIYSAVGFGQTYDSPTAPSGTRYRRDGLVVQCVGESCFANYQVDALEWGGDTGICSGDSGGPAIDAQGRVVGVASRGGPDCTVPIYGHVFGWGQWIKDNAVYAASLMGVDPPAWATGWPTDPAFSMPVGAPCAAPEQCPSLICNEGFCSRPCNDVATCPGGFGCDPEFGICERRVIPAPDESRDNGDPSGCSFEPAPSADDPTQPIPWAIGLGLLAAAGALRRRRPRG